MRKFVQKISMSCGLIAFLLVYAISAPSAINFVVEPAYSQTKNAEKPKKRRNIFDILFGKRRSVGAKKANEKGKRIRLNRNGRPIKKRRVAAPVKPKVEKSPNARKILIAGDFMADGLAWGLTQLYTDNPNIVIVSIAKGLSGLVRDDVKNWPVEIGTHIDEVKPAAIVFLAGMNDRQQMRTQAGKFAKLSDSWNKAYNNRVQGIIDSAKARNTPLFWVGLPPARSSKMTADYLLFNAIYKSKIEAVNGQYIDIWDGFTNAEGQFISAGPDVNGQIKRLRGSDGINMTKTGKRKLAFYIERALRKQLGLTNDDLLASLPGLEDNRPVTPEYDPAKSGKTIVYSLASPIIDGITVLEGDQIDLQNKTAKQSVSYSLVVDGKLPYSHPGRVDYFGIASAKPKEPNPKSIKRISAK